MGGAAALLAEDLPKVLPKKALFRELREDLVASAVKSARIIQLKPNDFLERPLDDNAGHRFYFVLDGQIGVVRNRRLGIEDGTPKSHLPNPGREYVLSLVENDFFSDEFLALSGSSTDPKSLRCVAIMHTNLVSLPAAVTRELMSLAPQWGRSLQFRNAEIRRHYESHHAGDLRVVQDFYMQHNFTYATTMKVIDLDRCIGCDGCERACADRHGVARLERKGPALGRLSFAIACRTCVDHRCYHACGFDAIAIDDNANHEVKFLTDKCVGCAACYSACPNSVITMQEKPYVAADFPTAMPDTDLEGRTNVPNLFLVGEATGTALIKLAINAGRKAVEVIAAKLKEEKPLSGVHDVLVVGAGPAGLSASLSCLEFKLHFKTFDKGDFNTTIASYPRNKVVMAEPMHIPLYGNLWLKDTTKEELIQRWDDIIKRTGLQISSGETVEDVQKAADGLFDVKTNQGKYRAKFVVLATGARGTPRKLECPGESEPRVKYQLTEPDHFRGKHCLVVGGGDSAVEAAMSLADAPNTTVTLSYRKDSFGRIKPRNKTRLEEYGKAGRVKIVLESSVKKIDEKTVELKCKDGMKTIPNEQIFALLGGEPPTKFFEKIGIRIIQPATPDMDAFAKSRGIRRYSSKCDHCFGHSDQACISACPTGAIIELKPDEVFVPVPTPSGERPAFKLEPFERGIAPSSRYRRLGTAALMMSLLAATIVGLECFCRMMVPEWSLLHRWQLWRGDPIEVTFSSGQGLGYVLGIVGCSMMAATALYPLHSRLGLFRKLAKTQVWLAAHIMAGILGPVFVTYHTLLKLNRWPSVAFWLTWAVVFTGAVGRYVYTFMRRAQGLSDMETQRLEAERRKLKDELASKRGHTAVLNILDLSGLRASAGSGGLLSAIGTVFLILSGEVGLLVEKVWLRYFKLRNVSDKVTRDRALEVLVDRKRKESRALLLDSVSKSTKVWRTLHLIATIVMFAVAIAHIVAASLFKVS
jgi:thioredoxin reductase/NAD-dependent dihydropyrimidine dehydrogenase PreA subunit